MKRYEDIVLDLVRLRRHVTIDADLVAAKLAHKITASELRLLEDEDAYQRRYILNAFGKHEIWKVSCPTTWWQHLKLALKTKWPRLFKRLRVRRRTVEFDSGWVCPDLATKAAASRAVIPYVVGPNIWERTE